MVIIGLMNRFFPVHQTDGVISEYGCIVPRILLFHVNIAVRKTATKKKFVLERLKCAGSTV